MNTHDDRGECVWRPPLPVLFQRRFTTENRAITDGNLRRMLNAALACTGLTDPADGRPCVTHRTISGESSSRMPS